MEEDLSHAPRCLPTFTQPLDFDVGGTGNVTSDADATDVDSLVAVVDAADPADGDRSGGEPELDSQATEVDAVPRHDSDRSELYDDSEDESHWPVCY